LELALFSGRHVRSRRLDELRYLIWVGDHRHVPRKNFDGSRAHAAGELAFSVRRDCLVLLGDEIQLAR
jgi:hypothetical protein